ncbi:ABC transporter ATP-binding protein [Microvirga terrae]|uniref:ABC transporter ATP-binding protein n=1 Tax=Microvirga terrae TaxID=2740529 RepID=A0ABY5RXC4_9HYPH|nr:MULTISPECIES: ABC transporter ATP-binding protein [Microvirga]MBQ0821104.1 ABC transporter ATP-binding protein [Microvirga sp. HBU67558]UVF21584.1 ABC transporter ATP-binding protein [Microvirga terrae]
MSEITLRNLTKSYGSHLALPSLDLDIPKGSFVTLLGPSGCGKTTTLRVIAGLEQATTGEVVLGGKTVYSSRTGVFVPPERRGLGFIFQSYALWPNMKVDRNITLALAEAKQSAHVIKERLAEALAKVQLTGLADRYPSELSGGQQQRVAVARLIAARNSVLLMDEPLSNLDAKLRTEMRTELKRLHRELQATTVYVTHDQVEALTMSDIIVVMKDGVIQQQGSPYEIYHNPANLFVAEFIGDPRINLLDGNLATVGGERIVRFEDAVIPVLAGLQVPDGPVTFAIRPENITIVERQGPFSLQAEVDIVQPTGSQTIISLTVRGHRVTALIPRFETSLPKKTIWIEFPPDQITLFDKGSGNRLPLAPPVVGASHAA